MVNFVDLTGRNFGRLTVKRHTSSTRVECICTCGTIKNVYKYSLFNAPTRSCGCWKSEITIKRNTKHGLAGTPTYKIWKDMRKRCNNKTSTSYRNYGGRGIRVCYRWGKFQNFLADMGERPLGYSIDRINYNGNYNPSNCRWANRIQQNNNSRQNVFITYNNECLTIGQWAARIGIKYNVLYMRLNEHKWPIERALTQPLRIFKNSTAGSLQETHDSNS